MGCKRFTTRRNESNARRATIAHLKSDRSEDRGYSRGVLRRCTVWLLYSAVFICMRRLRFRSHCLQLHPAEVLAPKSAMIGVQYCTSFWPKRATIGAQHCTSVWPKRATMGLQYCAVLLFGQRMLRYGDSIQDACYDKVTVYKTHAMTGVLCTGRLLPYRGSSTIVLINHCN